MKQNVIMKITLERVRKIDTWRELDAQIKKLTTERDAIRDEIDLDMQAHGASVCTHRNEILVEMRERVTNTVDGKRLRAEHPDIAQEYTKTSVSRKPHYVS